MRTRSALITPHRRTYWRLRPSESTSLGAHGNQRFRWKLPTGDGGVSAVREILVRRGPDPSARTRRGMLPRPGFRHFGRRLPDVYLGFARPGPQRFIQSGGEAADSFADVGRLRVRVDVPIFEGGRIHAQIAKERSLLKAAQKRLRKLELQIRLEVETAVLNVNSARKRIDIAQKSIAEAEESLRIERQKYDCGRGAIVDVLDAQAALLNAKPTTTAHWLISASPRLRCNWQQGHRNHDFTKT